MAYVTENGIMTGTGNGFEPETVHDYGGDVILLPVYLKTPYPTIA